MGNIQKFADEFYQYFAEHGVKFERHYSMINNWIVVEHPIEHEYAPGVPAVEIFQGITIPYGMHGKAWPDFGKAMFVSKDWMRSEPTDGQIPHWAEYYIRRGEIKPDIA